VRKITTKDGRVTGVINADGSFEGFDTVASNADVMHTYRELLADDPRGKKVGKALEKKRWSPSLFVVYFGLKTTASRDPPPHNLLWPALSRADRRDL
jgi:phytoene desaturase